jgi:hypothetical protein
VTRRFAPDSRNLDRIPTPDDLDRAPELAILAALDHTLELAAAALAGAHPELCDPERPYWLGSPTRSLTIAKTLVPRIRGLQRAIRAYRRALEIRRPQLDSTDRDDLDF